MKVNFFLKKCWKLLSKNVYNYKITEKNCFRFKRDDSEIDNTGNEDSDDSAAAEDYQSKSKKSINKGRWSKEEVRTTSNVFFFMNIVNYHQTL